MNTGISNNGIQKLNNKPMRYDPVNGFLIISSDESIITDPVKYREYHGHVAWLYNPWTGQKRDARDIGSDTFGHLIIPSE